MRTRRDFLAAAWAASILGTSRSSLSAAAPAGPVATDAMSPAGEYML